jgi:light-regulated signal transduction histidine kinase (bacteriophytochrome)
LKTPLRSVSLFTEQLADSMGHKLDPDSETSLQFIRQGARQAQDMIHRLLQYAMAANHDRVETATDLEDALAGALGDLQNSARETNATITNDPLPVVQGDGDSLRQLLLNLLANAIKYRGKQAPEIHVAARDAGTEWIISVRDNGIGINPHYAGKVFELFERLHSASEYEGSGIGLSICRRIVQRHGGRIWFESELGHGCTFYFTLPIVQTSRESAAPLKTTSTTPRLVASSKA